MSSMANSEQILAIEHDGGVLLQAGAGSGKTFVLIEHITYIIENCLFDSNKNLRSTDVDLIRETLKNELSRIVLMTFTKKAAGELSIRLSRKIEAMLDSYPQGEINPWETVKESIDYLTVSTIDGFCFKLLKEGFLPDFTPNLEVIMYSEFRNKIQVIFSEWLEEHTAHIPDNILELLVFHRDGVLTSLYKIFSNPELRILWKDIDASSHEEFSIEKTLEKTFKFEGILDAINNPPYHGEYHEYSDKPWCKFLEGFSNVSSLEIPLYEKHKKITEYLATFKKTPSQPQVKLGLVEVNEFFENIKKIKKFNKDFLDDYLAYEEKFEGIVEPWMNSIKDLVSFIDRNYMTIPGITFADLEYYVLLGVRDKEISKRILNTYNYFIIDEFQDTSFVQFEIIEQITGGDYSKIFCVGDVKQAIYGFKGGEIKVFKECEKNIPLNLNLSNNYRSNPNIININNDLFDHTFNLGLGFKDQDFDPVNVVFQHVPEQREYESDGELYRIAVTAKHEGDLPLKLKSWDINKLEAREIFLDLEKKIKNNDYDQYAILYKNLGPSFHLIKLLIEEDLGFSAQIKIPFPQDPIIGVFRTLLEFLYDSNTKNLLKNGRDELEFTAFMINSYLDILKISTVDLLVKVHTFYKNIKAFGLYNSFEKLLFQLGISNSNQENNLAKIQSICKLAKSYDHIISLLETGADDKYSLEFQAGSNSRKIIMMTAHASKGLEFEHVYLAGIYTNGRTFPNTDSIGKLPGSFKWHEHVRSRASFKTPIYIYENIFEKHKNFSESKRLFYVASSRAQKALAWVDIDFDNTKYAINGNSWVKGIWSWQDANLDRSKDVHKVINKFEQVKVELLEESAEEDEEKQKPLFHQDTLGLAYKENSSGSLLVLPELSVTKASIIVQCPRKFYLRNVCKLDNEDLDLLELNYNEFELEKKSEYIEVQEVQISSSAERGTFLHSAMEYAANHNFVLPRWDELKDKDLKGLNWCLDILKQYKEAELIPEKLIKFSLFGHMITGTPDLVLLDHAKSTSSLWDYKSGRRKPETEPGYWFQLNCYAYALYQLGLIKKDSQVDMKLMYLDMQEVVAKTVSYNQVIDYLKAYWVKTSNPDEMNQDHCESCQFQNICQN
jgi:ATP-dependent helicase/nuclease subunit A